MDNPLAKAGKNWTIFFILFVFVLCICAYALVA